MERRSPLAPSLARSRYWRTSLTGLAFVLPFLILYVLFLLWPIILGLGMSFYNWSLADAGKFLGFGNYLELFADSDFWSSLWHTITFTVISTPIFVIFGLSLALLANRAIPARWLFRLSFFAPFVLPVSIVVILWNWLFQPGYGFIDNAFAFIGWSQVDWLNDPNLAMLAVIVVTLWWTVGSNFLLYLAGLQQIPQELYEAAAIDGAGARAKTLWVTLPLLGRITMLIVILQVIASLQVFGQIYLLTQGGPNFATRPVIQYIYETGFSSYRIGYASAISYILFILILIFTVGNFLLFGRQERRSEAL
ncbi:sugar ABC transporter permease [Ktedonosporobacter rubrisoli]|uniref:Sugar ABC transporter permease n=2 Tax=Ktedonosporobacter rubrisoli TaxID=2509675 RepID=A0A4P6K5V1_KTERU|nr:sugar ABC transporter permease [Ktedonosporobacter rubrisoli]